MLKMSEAEKYEGMPYLNGYMCRIPCNGVFLVVIVSIDTDDKGITWEHVSVSHLNRLPTWHELRFIKRLLWEPEDEVMQFFPPQSEHVNAFTNVLHLWRPRNLRQLHAFVLLRTVSAESLRMGRTARAIKTTRRLL